MISKSKSYRRKLGGSHAASRSVGTRAIKKLFIIITEGETERVYFTMDIFKPRRNSDVKVKVICEKSKDGSDPEPVLSSMKNKIKSLKQTNELRSGDSAWLVLDDDDSQSEEFQALDAWAAERHDRFIAYTKPQFEWWLLLHYRDGAGIVTKSKCLAALHDKQPNYQKGKALPITLDEVNNALSHADELRIQRDTPIAELHEKAGALTTVHFLVHDLLTAIGVQ
ncbi:RloB family protein [Corynebacterium matruchotii]|jgi:hypothetical protein